MSHDYRYPNAPLDVLQKMIEFSDVLTRQIFVERRFGYGCGDINLRDLFRWCQLLCSRGSDLWDPCYGVDIVYGLRMRRATDRARVAEVFEAIFKCPPALFMERASFSITPTHIFVGHSVTSRCAKQKRDTRGGELVVSGTMLPLLEALFFAVEHKWVVTLVGPSCAGKSSLATIAAQLSGRELTTFYMNSSVDTMELLGGFEQIDLTRDRQRLYASVVEVVNEATESLFLCDAIGKARATTSTLAVVWQRSVRTFRPRRDTENIPHMYDEWMKLLSDIRQRLPSFGGRCDDLRRDIGELSVSESRSQSGAFQWRDGLLVDALRKGHWLLIDNVNFCNPSVLDRLNGLLEPGGALVLNERGVRIPNPKACPSVFTPHRITNPCRYSTAKYQRLHPIRIFESFSLWIRETEKFREQCGIDHWRFSFLSLMSQLTTQSLPAGAQQPIWPFEPSKVLRAQLYVNTISVKGYHSRNLFSKTCF